jgi:hypothetical protein
MLSKPFDQITLNDISDLCAQGGAYESAILEFKRELPGRDGKPDPWLSGKDFTSYARDRLFREIVAFANAQGGTLVLGIEETEDQPPRAQRFVPIPRVHDLAARLEEPARACIEPPLSSLLVRGIVTEGADGGVVIFRTVASPFGPHRVAGDGHAFIRRGPSSVRMTMREIQDLTLDLARRVDRLDEQFARRQTLFAEWFARAPSGEKGGIRLTAAPVASLPRTIRVADTGDKIPLKTRFQIQLGDGDTHEVLGPFSGNSRPIVRGWRYYETFEDRGSQVEVFDSGLIDAWFWHSVSSDLHLHLGWILGSFLSIHRLVEWFRVSSESPDWEFALELGVCGLKAIPGVDQVPLPTLVIGTWNTFYRIKLTELPIRFPRLVSRSRSDEQLLLNMVGRDLLDAAGDPRLYLR